MIAQAPSPCEERDGGGRGNRADQAHGAHAHDAKEHDLPLV
jgi:hypothetical protein